MKPLTIVARLRVKPPHLELAKESMLANIAPTRAEEGCIQYDLHQDRNDPTLFLFYETWASRELWQKHMASPHIQTHREKTKDAMLEVDIYEMDQIP